MNEILLSILTWYALPQMILWRCWTRCQKAMTTHVDSTPPPSVGRSVFESLFQIILIGVLSLSLGSIEMMGILFFWIQWGFGSPASQSLFTIWNSFQAKEKNQNGYISLTLARNEKIRPLYFIQLLKLNKTKWSYFFNLS